MCGGYTRVCVRCGLCGKVEPRPALESGVCPLCGHENGPDADTCAECGTRIPKAPGSQMRVSAGAACGRRGPERGGERR